MEKEYLPIDLSKNKCYAMVEEMMKNYVSPVTIEKIARIAVASYFVHRNSEQRPDPLVCPSEICGGEGTGFQHGVGRWADDLCIN
ncbi:MAG: hypothetical protein RR138_00395 [Akkermansia sp.]